MDYRFQKIVKEEECGQSTIENVVFEEDLIKFDVINIGFDDHLTRINLRWDNLKRIFIDIDGNITAELFINDTKRIVHGKWREKDTDYTWWAITD